MAQRPIKLLQIASTSQIGGAEQIILSVVRHADRARIEPSVLALMDDGPLADLAAAAGASPAENWHLKTLRDFSLARRMRHFLAEGKFDVVQGYGLRAEALTRWIAHGLGIPFIASVCSIDPWRRGYHVILDQLTMDGVTLWISTSEAAKRAKVAREGVPEHRIVVIPTGIPDRPLPDEASKKRAKEKFGVGPDEGPVLAVIANIRAAKGHGDLIDALAILKERFPGIVCLCAGRDDSGGEMKRRADAKSLGRAVRWLGFRDDAPEVYDAADLAVLPSHWEGMPLAAIEALRAGLPIVATRVGGIPEVIRDGAEGWLCAASDARALASAIATALEDPARDRGKSARAKYEKDFMVLGMVEKMTEAWERTVKNGAARD